MTINQGEGRLELNLKMDLTEIWGMSRQEFLELAQKIILSPEAQIYFFKSGNDKCIQHAACFSSLQPIFCAIWIYSFGVLPVMVRALTLNHLAFYHCESEPHSGHKSEKACSVYGKSVDFLWILGFSPTPNDWSVQYKWNILERAVTQGVKFISQPLQLQFKIIEKNSLSMMLLYFSSKEPIEHQLHILG